MTDTFTLLLCPQCGAALGRDQEVMSCTSCGASYPMHFGIVDLRVGPLSVAGATFDREADLREATRLASVLAGTTHKAWFFRGVDEAVARIEDPRFRRLMGEYYRVERQTYGEHGAAILAKLDAFLAAKEHVRWEDWRRAARVVLEAGCGSGQYPLGFAPRFREVLVTDISYVSLVQAQKVAQDNGLRNVRLFAATLESIPLPDASVDLVHCNGVIEHVNDHARVVAECARVTSPAGLTLMLSPNLYSIYTEAHFRVPAFGFWPMTLRRWLSYRASGARSFAGTELRSLGDMTRSFRRAFAHHRAYFLPPRLPRSVRGGIVRRLIGGSMRVPVAGWLVDLLLNRVLLRVMPYHVFVGFKR